MDLYRKLEILADAAKYDASCASSGTEQRDSSDGQGLGSTAPGMGICHSYAPDGRCISLLKVLLTNACNYDCLYCVNRTSSNVPRARFTVDEVVKLTLDFYRRNYIEASREELLRVPGFGTKAVDRIIATRRLTSIRVADLSRLHIPKSKALPFIVLSDHRPSPHLLDGGRLAERFRPKAAQLGFGF